MATVSTLSKAALMRTVGVTAKQNKKIVWRNNSIVVKQMITAKEFFETVQNILHDCTSDAGEFAPELLDFAVRVNVIAAFAYVELPTEFEELFYAAYASDLFDAVYKNTNKAQIDAIKNAVEMYAGNVGDSVE